MVVDAAAIRLEHLQDITEEQAKLELVKSWPGISVLSATEMERGHSWRDGFFWLWDSIYAKQPTKQWFSNPQVWALGFRRSETVFVGEAK